MFRVKQISMVTMLGLAIVLATVTVYTQSALGVNGPGLVKGFGGVNGGGSASGQDGQGQNDNSQGSSSTSSSGGQHVFSGMVGGSTTSSGAIPLQFNKGDHVRF